MIKLFACGVRGECSLAKPIDSVACCAMCPDRSTDPISTPPRWVPAAELLEVTRRLIHKIPQDVTDVAGVTRSGMPVASLIACLTHRPLWEIHPQSIRQLGSGFRLEGQASPAARQLLIVDDTVASGTSMRRLRAALSGLLASVGISSAVTAAAFVSPTARNLVDIAGEILPLPHYLEWNFFNSVHSSAAALDFDGILCDDCPADRDDDGPSYLEWIKQAPPRWLPRRSEVPLIVTARLERYREPTLEWLARHGVRVRKLVMGQWRDLADRRVNYEAGTFKGQAYRNHDCTIFVESCPDQAAAIARVSGKRVICPAAGRVWL